MAQIGLICRLARENPQCGYLRSRFRGRRHLPVTRSADAACSATSSTSTTSQLEPRPTKAWSGNHNDWCRS